MLKFYGDGLEQPSLAVLDSNLSTRLPRFSWAIDRVGTATSGAGLALDSMQRALGEYYERRHFYFEVRGEKRASLSSLEDLDLQVALSRCFEQTAHVEVLSDISKHDFNLSRVLMLPEWKYTWLPTVMFSVTGNELGKDKKFLPRSDTTGCAVHFTLDKAILSAFKELVERQYLLRYWLTGGWATDVTSALCNRLSGASLHLAEKLDKLGTIRFLELAGGEIGGAIILAVYRGAGDPSVRYCVGLAYDGSIQAAGDRALKELWQSYIFLRNMAHRPDAASRVHDRYHTYFLDCNRLDVADAMIGSGHFSSSDRSSVTENQQILESICSRFGRIYAYVREIRLIRRRLWCVRAVCPEAFLHIDNSSNFNLNCKFSQPFLDRVLPIRSQTMVPFP